MKEVETELVFVYGTLKKGKSAHGYLKGAEFLGEAWINGTMYGKNGKPYPMVKFSSMNKVFGEIYAVTPDMLEGMDHYEGHPTLYKRIEVPVHEDSNGAAGEAWCYEFQGDTNNYDVILEGRF